MEESVFYSKDVSPPYPLHDHKGVQPEQILNDGCLEECYLHQQGSSLPTDRVASTQRAGNDPSLDCGLTDGNHESSGRKIRVQEDHVSCKNKNQSQDDGAALPQTQQQQNFHHPHFNHHRRRQRSIGHTGAYSVRRSPRSLSVNEGEDQVSHTHSQGARSPAKSSHSLDHSSVWPDNGLPQSASPGKRNKAVTDLDQAMLERDEMKLRSLCGDRMNNISFGYIPNSYGSAAGCIDLETETNLDDDPVNVKYMSTISVARQKCLASGEVEGAIRLDEKYIHSIILDEVVKFPVEMPPKLHFSHSEVFDGQLLLHWLTSHFDSSHYLSLILTKHDIMVLVSQFCTHLLAAGVLSPIQGQQSLREHVFKPNGHYYWTKQDPSPVQADVPGRLQPMWPPTQGEADDEAKPLLKYTEAEHQAAMVLMRRDYNQEVDRLQKEHAEELDRVHSDYRIRLEDLRAQVHRLEQEVEKCKQLASLDRLTQTALSHAQAAQNEAGLAETDEKGSHMHGKNHAVIGTPQTGEQKSYHSQVATPECVTVNFSHSKKDSPSVMPPLKTPVELTPAGYMQEYDHPYATDSDSATSVSPPVPPPPPPPLPPTAGLPPPPPPPPPPGMGRAVPPPPPPLGGPPASGFVVSLRRTPSKPIISPRSPMKPLFWKRIQVHTLKQESAAERSLFWETIEEAKVDMEEFDDLFSKVSVAPVKKSATKPKANAKKQAAKVIDAKRSQAVGILLSTTRLDMSEIEHAILHLDTSLLDIEKFKAIYENRPSPEEIRLIKKQLDSHPDVPLDKPEQFLYDLHQIPGCANRIFCFIFQSTFQENISVIENKLNNLKMTCEMLMEGPQIKNIFGLILALGNYMNGGSRTRGQADGFELEILPKLKDYKGKDNRTCLLQYLVMQYVRNFEKDDAGTERVKLPVPDPSDIVQAGLVSFEDMEKELTRIRRDFDLAEARAAEVIRTATEDNKEPFDSLMQAFFHKGRSDMADGEEMLKTVSERFYQMVNFFCVKPKEGEEFVKPEYFFSLWLSFCQNFKDYWKREQQRIVKLRLREVENRLRKIQESKKAVQTRAKTAGGLKDRLSKLSKK